MVKLRRIAIIVFLAAVTAITGCASAASSQVASQLDNANNTGNAQVSTELPQATPAPPATETPTRVATYPATNTPTATPASLPTSTPVSSVTPTTETEAGLSLLQPIEQVVLISIDGLRPDAMELANTPTLDALRLAGVYSPNAQAVVPSVTLVNHASMLGGMAPEKHGIDWNVADSSKGKINGPTLFTVAHNAGLSTAMVVGKPKLDHINLPGSVDDFIYAGYTDIQVANRSIELIKAGLPNVLFIHLPDVDSAGHLVGWMSTAQLLALANSDRQIGKIVDALETGGYLENTLLIITSDHGGSGTSHGSNSPEDTTILWLAVGPNVPAGVMLTDSITTYDTAATILYALNLSIPLEWDGQPVLESFSKSAN